MELPVKNCHFHIMPNSTMSINVSSMLKITIPIYTHILPSLILDSELTHNSTPHHLPNLLLPTPSISSNISQAAAPKICQLFHFSSSCLINPSLKKKIKKRSKNLKKVLTQNRIHGIIIVEQGTTRSKTTQRYLTNSKARETGKSWKQ